MKHIRLFITFSTLAFLLPQFLSAQTNAASPAPAAIDSITVEALKAEPNAASLYEIGFVTRDTLATDAEILLGFPPESDLGALEIVGSSTINGGWTLAKDNRRATLRRTGIGEAIPPGRRVNVKLGLITNPPDTGSGHQVEVEIKPSAKKPGSTRRQVEIGFR